MVSVPPGTRPWWSVRRRFRFVLALLVILWIALSLQRSWIDQIVMNLPLSDAIVLRFAGY